MVVRRLPGNGVAIDEPDRDGWTALHHAARNGWPNAPSGRYRSSASTANVAPDPMDTPK